MLNVLDLIKDKAISPKKVAGTYRGEYHSPCPGCGGKDRFCVWPEENDGQGSYWCRQCGKGGDAIQFLIDFEAMTFPQACQHLGRELPTRSPYRAPVPPGQKAHQPYQANPDPESPPDKWIEKATALVNWAHAKLITNPSKLKWLSARGIRKKTVERFRLGWNLGKDGKDIWRPRELWGLETVLKNNGHKKRLWLPQGLVIPHIVDGEVHRIRIRRTKDEPRYYIIPGSAMDYMILRPNSRAFVIVEAELDAILLDQECGDICGAMATGSSSAKPHALAAAKLKDVSMILLALDYDAAGAKALAWWQEHFPQSMRWPVPEGKDPGDAYKKGVDIAAWIRSGLPPGWRFGPSFEKQKKREGPQEKKPVPKKVPSAVKELVGLLRQHPVSICVTPNRTHIRHTQKWARENWDVSKRISELVFMTEEVMDYVEAHPAEVINGRNIL